MAQRVQKPGPEAPPMELLVSEPASTRCTLVLAHGAGAPMDSPFMESVAAGLAEHGIRVVRFEFPYMAERRRTGRKRPPDRMPVLEAAFEAVVRRAAGAGSPVAVGGKSMGARVAASLADRLGAAVCVALGYPFHPPGRPEKTRTAPLEKIRTPTVVVQGTRDPFGRPDEVAAYALSPAVRVHWIGDGDHSLAPRKRSGRTPEQCLAEAVQAVAEFIGEVLRAGSAPPRV